MRLDILAIRAKRHRLVSLLGSNHLAPARLGLGGRECKRAGRARSAGAGVAEMFFNTSRHLRGQVDLAWSDKTVAIDLQKMNQKFRTGLHEHTGIFQSNDCRITQEKDTPVCIRIQLSCATVKDSTTSLLQQAYRRDDARLCDGAPC